MRRLMWRMNAFSKRFENLCHTLALSFVLRNFLAMSKTVWVTVMDKTDAAGASEVRVAATPFVQRNLQDEG
ncbi:MAG TPA: hypothetical protein VE111_11865 [Bradyrhizobium sp.]|nr:hypothetical protein [Bradyrhizobium sp.]